MKNIEQFIKESFDNSYILLQSEKNNQTINNICKKYGIEVNTEKNGFGAPRHYGFHNKYYFDEYSKFLSQLQKLTRSTASQKLENLIEQVKNQHSDIADKYNIDISSSKGDGHFYKGTSYYVSVSEITNKHTNVSLSVNTGDREWGACDIYFNEDNKFYDVNAIEIFATLLDAIYEYK